MNTVLTSEFLVTIIRWLISLSTGYLVANGTISISDKATFNNGIYDIFIVIIVLSVAILEHQVATKKNDFIEEALTVLQAVKVMQAAKTELSITTPTTTTPVQSVQQ